MKPTRPARQFAPAALFALTLALGGCGHYKMGGTVPQTMRNVSVPVFANDTEHAEVGRVVTKAIREKMINQGAFSIVPDQAAGLRVQGAVSNYSGGSVRYDRNHSTSVDEYRMSLTVTIDLVEPATGNILLGGRRITGATTFITRGDYLTGMQDALPRAADDIARQVIDLIQGLNPAGEEIAQ